MKNIKKRTYTSPIVSQINIDNEISLVLVTGHPIEPFSQSNTRLPESFHQDPIQDSHV